jgi:hypothetical protein
VAGANLFEDGKVQKTSTWQLLAVQVEAVALKNGHLQNPIGDKSRGGAVGFMQVSALVPVFRYSPPSSGLPLQPGIHWAVPLWAAIAGSGAVAASAGIFIISATGSFFISYSHFVQLKTLHTFQQKG